MSNIHVDPIYIAGSHVPFNKYEISGYVKDGTTPLSGVMVHLVDGILLEFVASAITDSSGFYSIKGIPEVDPDNILIIAFDSGSTYNAQIFSNVQMGEMT